MKNILKKIEEDQTEFFVMKSYITTIFESGRKKPEYHIFFIKKNSSPEAYYEGYKDLKMRRMTRIEVKHFFENIDSYNVVMENSHGSIFNLKSKPFDKKKCTTFKQLMLSL